MIKQILIQILFGLLLAGNSLAAEAADFLISIYHAGQDKGQRVLLYSDTTTFVKNMSSSAFLFGVSVDLKLTKVDSTGVEYDVHLVTLGPQAKTLAKRFTSDYELPGIIGGIEVKKDVYHSISIVPLMQTEVDLRQCSYNHNSSSDFSITPSANLDLHHLPQSLADYHAVSIKSLIEAEYRQFRDFFHFKLAGKQDLYLFPCQGYSTMWDKRFGSSFDPTRSNVYALYRSGMNTADPFLLIHGAVLRSYGYAPLFLTEGFANYFSLAISSMKQAVADKTSLPLADMLNTKSYLSADPLLADVTSATFVRFLIDEYTFDKFVLLYEKADDNNLKQLLIDIYNLPLSELEKSWLDYVDSVTIENRQYGQFAQRAEQMFNYSLMLEYTKKFAAGAVSKADSLYRYNQLSRAYFFNGDYYNASETQELLVKIDSQNYDSWLGLATFRMMNGEIEIASADLKRSLDLDSLNVIVGFNLVLNQLLLGDTLSAVQSLNDLIGRGDAGQIQAECRVMLGDILKDSDKAEDTMQARDYFTVALSIFSQQQQTNPALATPYMWSGIALIGLGDAENARDQLELALFLESRPFYIGMINLWLGKTADISNNRQTAEDYYSQVLSAESASYHQDEARRLLEKPFRR
ncbi:MAG: hypothetical protein IIA17_10470 [candidate division Zixibacteria bacterium]|nr:hypothetical protein [candidate division Zixibacteria bacterium]